MIDSDTQNATAQVLDYADRQRTQKQYAQMTVDMEEFVTRMQRKYGPSMVFGMMAKYVGIILIEAPTKIVTREIVAFLRRQIRRHYYCRLLLALGFTP